MKADADPKPGWFQCGQGSDGLLVGKKAMRLENGDTIDQSMNDDGSRESYHISRTGEILRGENLVKIENWDDISHSTNYAGDKNYHNRQSYGKLQEEGYEQFEQFKKQKSRSSNREGASTSSQLNSKRNADSNLDIQHNRPVSGSSGFGCLMKENDCLDITFDSIESYACKERTGGTFPAGTRPPSPIVSYNYQQTFNEQKEELKSDAYSSSMTRENSILDVESAINPGEHSFSTAPLEKSKQDRLEQLRQSKRAIEKERLGFGQNQTIVIPRSSLYESEEECIEEVKSSRSISKLQAGSFVTNKQAKKYYFRRKLAFAATILLISVGIVVLAIALFWPARIL